MIDVELGTEILGYPKASYELGFDGPVTEVVVRGYEGDTYESVAQGMYRALALLGFRGELRLFYDGMVSNEEEKKEIFATIDRLKGTLQITDEDAARIAAEEYQATEGTLVRFKQMASLVREEGLRRGLTKEEREKLTLGEALESQEAREDE